jgi:hypothetical protein
MGPKLPTASDALMDITDSTARTSITGAREVPGIAGPAPYT